MGWFSKKQESEGVKVSAEAEAPPAIVEEEIEAVDEADEEEIARPPTPAALADLFLVLEEHLTEIELEELSEIVASIPQPPPLVDRLTRGLEDMEELREAILSSPTLSAEVLRVVNSAAFMLRTPISSIEHAVTYLGATMVKGLVVQSAVAQVMSFETDVQKAAYMRVWRSSIIASAAAHAFAEALRFEHPSVFATRALLANVGDLALISARPSMASIYAPHSTLLARVEEQQAEIMANSAILSSLLAREWKLPEDLFTALRYSITPLSWPPDQETRSAKEQREDVLLYLACRVGDAIAYGGLKEIEEFRILGVESLDFFYLPEYLRRLDLGDLLLLLQDPNRNRRIRQTAEKFSEEL
ncbi:MAG: HDOD domain-containing protein [Halieaceae bacterium]|jgi:HD-like signal output (HDOD) protein|nr:HDOD domain-containing protein [Halieaceae bacterium]